MPRWFMPHIPASTAIASLCAATLITAPIANANPSQTQENSAPAQKVLPNQTIQQPKQELMTHNALGVSFESPAGFSDVQDLSRKTTGIVYPANAGDTPDLIVRLAEIKSDEDNWVQFNRQEEMGYAKFLFLGDNTPSSEYSQRIFFGQPLTGESQTRRSRRGYRYTELYVVQLESGRKLAIAFDADTLVPINQVEETINTVTQSLREEKSSKKKKKKQKQAWGKSAL